MNLDLILGNEIVGNIMENPFKSHSWGYDIWNDAFEKGKSHSNFYNNMNEDLATIAYCVEICKNPKTDPDFIEAVNNIRVKYLMYGKTK